MAISINSKMSGFQKWAEIHQPEKINKTRTRANDGAIAEGTKTPDLQPHRPWLVPGIGRL
jgi:hypothetical protein